METLERTLDRVSPQNLEAEQGVLGSMMIEKWALDKGLEILVSADFYRPAHQEIFEALKSLRDKDEPADLLTLNAELRNRGKLDDVGGTEYLMALVDTVPTAANIEHYAKIVEEKAIRQRVIATASRLAALAYQEDSDILEVLDKAEKAILRIGQRRIGNDFVWMPDVYFETYNEINNLGDQFGLPIGLAPLADHCVKFMAGECIVIGARPSVGKSALAYQLLEHAAKHGGVKAAIISCEMTEQQFALRQYAGTSGVDIRKMLQGSLEEIHWDRLLKAGTELSKMPVAYYNGIGKKMSEIRAACRRMYAEGVRIFAIDHIHCVEPDNAKASRAVQLGQISRDCKRIALELNVPVLALAQLSREHQKTNKDALPTMGDLKESGDIEANADSIYLLWRPSEDLTKRTNSITKAQIVVAKNRQLGTATIPCGFFGRKFKFVPLEEHQETPGVYRGDVETEE